MACGFWSTSFQILCWSRGAGCHSRCDPGTSSDIAWDYIRNVGRQAQLLRQNLHFYKYFQVLSLHIKV